MTAQSSVVPRAHLETVDRPLFWEPSLAFLKIATFFILVGAVVFEIALFLFAPEQTTRAWSVLFLGLIAAIARILILQGRVTSAVMWLGIGVWGYITASSFILGGVASTTIIIYPSVVLLVGWLVSTRAATAVALLTTVVTFGFALLDIAGWLPPPAHTPPLMRWIIEAAVFIMSSVMIAHVVRSYRGRLDEVNAVSAELQARENDLQRAQGVAHIGSWVYDIANDRAQMSDEACRILGIPVKTPGSHAEFLKRVHVDDRSAVAYAWEAALHGGAAFDRVHRIVAHGETRWVHQIAELELSPEGHAVRSVGTLQDITERKRMEEALLESQSQLQCILGATADGILAVDREGKVIFANQRFIELWRVPQALVDAGDDHAMLGFAVSQLRDPDAFIAKVQALYQSDIESTDTITFKDDRVFERFTSPLILNKAVVGRVWSFRDVTERIFTEQALRIEEQRLRLALDASQQGWFDANVQTGVISVSEEYARMLGFAPTEFKSDLKGWIEAIHPNDRKAVAESFAECVTSGERRQMEYRRLTKSGDWKWIRSIGKIVEWDASGKPLRMTGTHADISERRQAEDALRVRDNALQNSIDAVAMADVDGRVNYVNEAFCKMWGLETAAQALARPFFDFCEDAGKARAIVAAILRDGLWRGEVGARRADGSIFEVELSASLATGSDGMPIAMMASFIDISERKRTQRNLNLAVEVTGVLIWELDVPTYRFRYDVNMLATLGLEAGEAPESYEAWRARVHLDDLSRFDESVAMTLQPGDHIFDLEYRLSSKAGEYQWLHTKGCVVRRDASGMPLLAVGTTTNIDARKKADAELAELNAELELRVANRTADLEIANSELNSFSYTIAHDMRAPVRAINGFSEMVLRANEGKLDLLSVGHLKRVVAGSRHMGALIDDLLNLARLSRLEMRRQQFNLSETAGGVAASLAAAQPDRSVAVVIQPGLNANGDPGLVRAVLDNLLGNAWKFTGKCHAPNIEFGAIEQGGDAAFFVRDNGAGFDMQYAHKLFAPFQRLHHTDEFEGTGIGLATVKKIVQRHGGRVWIESALGSGTTVYFTLG